MDVRLAAEAFARLNLGSRPRVGATSRAVCQRRQLHLPSTPYWQRTWTQQWTTQQRELSASSQMRSPPPPAGAAAEARSDGIESSHASTAPSASPQASNSRHQRYRQEREMPSDDELASLVDKALEAGNQAAPRTSRFKTPHAQSINRDPRTSQRPWQSTRFPSESSNRRRFDTPGSQPSDQRNTISRRPLAGEDNIADHFEAAMKRDPLTQLSRSTTSAGFIDQFQLKYPSETDANGEEEQDDLTDIVLKTNYVPREKPLPQSSLKLDSSVGRSIAVDPTRGVDLAKGLRLLDIRLAANRVRQDVIRQRFHERPGLKRKRLARQRWRKRFKDGFRHMVARVKYLTRQGW